MEDFMKPKILLTTRVDSDDTKKRAYVNSSYIDAIYAAGGTCAMLPYADQATIDTYVKMFDGLLVTGGEDTHGKYFKEDLHPLAVAVPSYIDETDLMLIKSFNQAHKPIFGICRGIQIINVAFGGSLIQDIPSAYPNIPFDYHQQSKRTPPLENYKFAHDVDFKEGSIMYEIFGANYGVNSFHHQALNNIPTKFQITATCHDGIVEAFESADQIIGVQWHPERLIQDEKHLNLFKYFVNLCQTND